MSLMSFHSHKVSDAYVHMFDLYFLYTLLSLLLLLLLDKGNTTESSESLPWGWDHSLRVLMDLRQQITNHMADVVIL